MKKILVATIDVEPDCTPTWQYSNPLSFEGVYHGVVNTLQPIFNKYSFIPTYLINNVVLEDERSVATLRSLGGEFELGTHLHPEFIEPNKEHSDYAGKKGIANCCNYPPETENEKIKSITNLFNQCFGYRPTSFRAGRFSAGANTIDSLATHGYLVDTSVTPHICWNDKTREIPVDFTSAPEQPYLVKKLTITSEDTTGRILEVPVSINLVKRNPIKELITSVAGIRHPFRSSHPRWLRPFYSTATEMIELVESIERKYAGREVVVFNLMFHNVEVMAGLSPYTKTVRDVDAYLQELEGFLNYCSNKNIQASRLSDLYAVFKRS